MPYPQPRVTGWDSTSNITGSTKAPISSQSNVNSVAVLMRGQPGYSHRPKQASVIHLTFVTASTTPRVMEYDNVPNEIGRTAMWL